MDNSKYAYVVSKTELTKEELDDIKQWKEFIKETYKILHIYTDKSTRCLVVRRQVLHLGYISEENDWQFWLGCMGGHYNLVKEEERKSDERERLAAYYAKIGFKPDLYE